MDTAEIKKMNVVERLQAMEMLWNALKHEEVEIKSLGWHHEIITERIPKIDNGDAKFLSLQELKAQ